MNNCGYENNINIIGKIYSIQENIDKNQEKYCILRLKIINTHKGKVTDTSLIDCFAYKNNYRKIMDEMNKNNLIRISGKLQKRNTKNHTIKITKIKKLEEI